MKRLLLISVLFCLLCPVIFAFDDSIPDNAFERKYKFIEYDSNFIRNPEILEFFFSKLDSLENGSIKKVRILHIGDSHIQADFFSGFLRKELWRRFGNGGRGLVFPYKTARTNGPSDLDVFSNATWEVKRNVFPEITMRTGISGIGIRTGTRHAILKIGLKPMDSIPQYFDRITVFTPGTDDQYDLMVSIHPESDILERTSIQYTNEYYTIKNGDYLGKIAIKFGTSVSRLREWNNLKNDRIYAGDKLVVKKVRQPSESLDLSSFSIIDTIQTGEGRLWCTTDLPFPMEYCFLHALAGDESQNKITIEGILLESVDSAGIVFSMTGVNGAKFKHYNLSDDFMTQAGRLQPDLVIISLGTNETLDASFMGENARREIDRFISSLKSACNDPAVLITIPPDNQVKRRYTNKKCPEIRELLFRAADSNQCAVWDLYEVMGGGGSMAKWKKAGLGRPDGIHFTREGYEVQAELLYDALIRSFINSKAHELE